MATGTSVAAIAKAVQRAAETESESADPNRDSLVLHWRCVRTRAMRLPRSDALGWRAIRYDPRSMATMRPVNNSVM